jgi:hypothetical protein
VGRSLRARPVKPFDGDLWRSRRARPNIWCSISWLWDLNLFVLQPRATESGARAFAVSSTNLLRPVGSFCKIILFAKRPHPFDRMFLILRRVGVGDRVAPTVLPRVHSHRIQEMAEPFPHPLGAT